VHVPQPRTRAAEPHLALARRPVPQSSASGLIPCADRSRAGNLGLPAVAGEGRGREENRK